MSNKKWGSRKKGAHFQNFEFGGRGPAVRGRRTANGGLRGSRLKKSAKLDWHMQNRLFDAGRVTAVPAKTGAPQPLTVNLRPSYAFLCF